METLFYHSFFLRLVMNQMFPTTKKSLSYLTLSNFPLTIVHCPYLYQKKSQLHHSRFPPPIFIANTFVNCFAGLTNHSLSQWNTIENVIFSDTIENAQFLFFLQPTITDRWVIWLFVCLYTILYSSIFLYIYITNL